jgi:predicted  nucleic acid-binding Zn-ribbon protein
LASLFDRIRRKSTAESAPIQRRLDEVQPAPQGKEKSVSVPEVSIKQLEKEVDDYLKEFQLYVKRVKETSLSLEELAKLLKSGEIPETAYGLIVDELGTHLSVSVEDVFKIRESLELAKAKAKLEWAKEKVRTPSSTIPTTGSPPAQKSADSKYVRAYTDVVRGDYFADEASHVKIYSSELQRWEELISKVDSALSSLPIEDETRIIEQYLSMIKEKISVGPKSAEIEKAFSLCRQRLGSISDRWALIRRSQIEKIMNLDLEASRMRDEIKELEARFSVGEIAQKSYEVKMSSLQTNLKKVEEEISNIRSSLDDMDMKIFRCSELSRENP